MKSISNIISLKFFGFFNRSISIRKQSFIIIAMLAVVKPVQAEAEMPDKFRIALGSFAVVRYDATMSLTDADLGAGISISPEDTLGVQSEQAVLRLDGYYRFTKVHSLTYSWYAISSDGNKSLDQEIDWIDENGDPITIPLGANINTSLDYDIFKVGYLYSFYNTDKVNLAVGAGLHMTRIVIGLSAEATGSPLETKDVDTTLPLPVFSFGIIYHVTPKFSWHIKSEFFALKFDKWDGSYTDATMGVEYRVFKNVGLGVALAINSLKVTEDTSDYMFIYDNRINGVLANAAAYF